jgi:hypothetical protein
VLHEPGIKIGRSDPELDPKGVLTVRLLDKAEEAHKLSGIAKKILGAPDNLSRCCRRKAQCPQPGSRNQVRGILFRTARGCYCGKRTGLETVAPSIGGDAVGDLSDCAFRRRLATLRHLGLALSHVQPSRERAKQ